VLQSLSCTGALVGVDEQQVGDEVHKAFMCIWHPMAERGALRDEHLVAVGGGVALVQLAAARVSLCVRVFMCL